MRRRPRWALLPGASFTGALLAAGALLATPARAAPPAAPPAATHPAARSLILLPTAVVEGGALRPPRPPLTELGRLAAALDALLSETAQDLGLAVVPPQGAPARLGDRELLDRAHVAHAPVLLPSLRLLEGGEVELRLVLAGAAARPIEARLETVARAELSVRAVVLLRDLLARHGESAPRPLLAPSAPLPSASWTAGRITLLSTSAVFGGLIGYSIQRASGSTESRLLYPLLAVGAGIGLGASLVVSAEWSTSVSDAWFFTAGAGWPSAAAHLIFQGRFADHRPDSDRWVFGLLGGTAGATLATLGLALRSATPGAAVMAHSGGGLGLGFGALLEVAARGDVHRAPHAGMGYGAALGWLAAAAVSLQVDVSPLRVLAFDAGAVGGALLGAGAASPLLLHDASAARQRAWAAIAAGTALAGGVTAAVLVTPRRPSPKLSGMPLLGVLGESRVGAVSAPIYGLGWSGVLE